MSEHAPRHVVAHGPRAVEAAWLAALREERDRVRATPALVARPLLVVVPSSRLREHVLARAAAELGALVAFDVRTLASAAHAILERARIEPPRGARLFRPLVREALRRNGALERELGAFERGFEPLVATLSDLFDAGYALELDEPLREALADYARAARLGDDERRRLEGVLDAAAFVARALADSGARHGSELFRAAARALARDPDLARARETWIVGLSDATGAQLELFAALAGRAPSRVFTDSSAGSAEGHGARVHAALGIPARAAPHEPRSDVERDAALEIVSAAARQAEVDHVAARVHALLAAGGEPERIAVVARDLERVATALSTRFARLGIPYSLPGARAQRDGATRRAVALRRLLAERDALPLDAWFAARPGEDDARRGDVRAALAALGARTLGDLARTDLVSRPELARGVPLPVRLADGEGESDDEDEEPRDDDVEERREPARRRRVPLADVEAEAIVAREALARFERWSSTADIETHARELAQLVERALEWPATSAVADDARRTSSALARDLPPAIQLSRALFLELADAELAALRPARLESTGGVRILSAADARGLTFDALFLAGLERDHFPRAVREDPLFPDAARAALRAVLPDLPLKTTGHDEERRLFDQLVRSAPRVEVSFARGAADGKALFESPLLARVAGARREDGARVPDDVRPRPMFERAVEIALAAGRGALARALPLALREASELHGLGLDDVDAIASARLWALDSLEPERRRDDLGAFHGLVGAIASDADPRAQVLPVTTIEAVARCGWRAFVGRVLRLEPAADPWAEVPSWDPLVLGNAVHAVLEHVVRRAAPSGRANERSLEAALAREPWPIDWPDERELERACLAAARAALHDAGVPFPGLERLLSRGVLACVRAAREIDARDEREGELFVFGAELEGRIDAPAGPREPRTLAFRADRAERAQGRVRLTDYKTGRPISEHATPAKRAEALAAAVARGTHLQAVAYALAVRGAGRYASLRAGVGDAHRVAELDVDDTVLVAAFARATSTAWSALELGALAPRLLDARARQSNRDCERCDVAIACVRGDTSARERLHRFLVLPHVREDDTQAAARALLALAAPLEEKRGAEGSP